MVGWMDRWTERKEGEARRGWRPLSPCGGGPSPSFFLSSRLSFSPTSSENERQRIQNPSASALSPEEEMMDVWDFPVMNGRIKKKRRRQSVSFLPLSSPFTCLPSAFLDGLSRCLFVPVLLSCCFRFPAVRNFNLFLSFFCFSSIEKGLPAEKDAGFPQP